MFFVNGRCDDIASLRLYLLHGQQQKNVTSQIWRKISYFNWKISHRQCPVTVTTSLISSRMSGQSCDKQTSFSMNQIRIRDVIAEDDSTFEVHKLEHIKDKTASQREKASGLMMRLQCLDEEEKNHWVRNINTEVKLLRNTTKNIASQMFML